MTHHVEGMVKLDTATWGDGDTGARQVHDSLTGIVGLARIALPEKQRAMLLPLLDATEVTQQGAETKMRARLTVEQFENM